MNVENNLNYINILLIILLIVITSYKSIENFTNVEVDNKILISTNGNITNESINDVLTYFNNNSTIDNVVKNFFSNKINNFENGPILEYKKKYIDLRSNIIEFNNDINTKYLSKSIINKASIASAPSPSSTSSPTAQWDSTKQKWTNVINSLQLKTELAGINGC
jgi:hypothetical protein